MVQVDELAGFRQPDLELLEGACSTKVACDVLFSASIRFLSSLVAMVLVIVMLTPISN